MVPDGYEIQTSEEDLKDFFQYNKIWKDIRATQIYAREVGLSEIRDPAVISPALDIARGRLNILDFNIDELPDALIQAKKDQIEDSKNMNEKALEEEEELEQEMTNV